MSHSPSSAPRSYPWWLIGTLALVFFALGVIGFRWGPHHFGVCDSLFQALQLFHLHWHWPHGEEVPLVLEVARFGAGGLGLAIIPLVLGYVFDGEVRRWWARKCWNGHVVVCGHCSRALSLLYDLRESGRKVVFIGRCPAPHTELPHGVLYIEGEAQADGLLASVALERATDLIALNEDDRANLEILSCAARHCEKHPPTASLTCHAHLQDNHLGTGLHRLVADGLKLPPGVVFRFFNYYETVARLLSCQYPLPPSLTRVSQGCKPPPDHIIIVGFGSFGQNVALKLIKMGQQLVHDDTLPEDKEWGVSAPRITVVDRLGGKSTHAFLRAHPAVETLCDFRVIEAECDSREFLELSFLTPEDAASYTSIVFCVESEEVSLRSVLLMQDICRSAEKDIEAIYVRIARPERLGPVLEKAAASPGKPRLVFFAPDSQVFSTDSILRQRLDVLARGCHEAYLEVEKADRRANNVTTAEGKTWEQLSESDRDNNREAADHLWAKLRTLGYALEVVPDGETAPQLDDHLIIAIGQNEEAFSRAEHYRWMTKRWMDGWRFGATRDNSRKLHPDLVPYEKLSEPTKDKDRINIRYIPKLLRDGRLRARKVDMGRDSS